MTNFAARPSLAGKPLTFDHFSFRSLKRFSPTCRNNPITVTRLRAIAVTAIAVTVHSLIVVAF